MTTDGETARLGTEWDATPRFPDGWSSRLNSTWFGDNAMRPAGQNDVEDVVTPLFERGRREGTKLLRLDAASVAKRLQHGVQQIDGVVGIDQTAQPAVQYGLDA